MAKHIFSFAFLFVAFFASAQDMSTEVVVDRTIPTSLPEAAPLKNVQPTLVEHGSQTVSLPQSDFGLRADFTPFTDELTPEPFTGIAEPDGYKGYLWAGYQPLDNCAASAGYRFINTKRSKVGVSVDFNNDGYTDRISGNDVKDISLGAKVFASHSLKNGLNITGLYAGSYNWLTTPGKYDLILSTPQEPKFKQGIAQHYADVKIKNSTEKLSYSLSADYRYSGLRERVNDKNEPPSEGVWHIDGDVRTVKKGFGFAMAVAADIVNSDYSNYTMLTFDPSLLYKKGNLTLDLGLRLNVDFGLDEFPSQRPVHVAPRVKALWRVAPSVAVYGRVVGGEQLHTLYNIMKYSPFAIVEQGCLPTYTPVDCRLGVRVGNFAGVEADVFVGYTATTQYLPFADINEYAFYRLSTDKVNGMHVGIKLEYTLSDRLEAEAEFILGPHAMTTEEYFDRASRSMSLAAAWTPNDNLKLEASWKVRGGRHYLTCNDARVGMGAVSDLDLAASYQISPALAAFVKLENLLNKRPLLLPGLAKPGFQGLVGLDFRF